MDFAVKDLYEKSQKTMPPAAPASLPPDTYADIVAYILETNGHQPGETKLPPGGAAAAAMTIR